MVWVSVSKAERWFIVGKRVCVDGEMGVIRIRLELVNIKVIAKYEI